MEKIGGLLFIVFVTSGLAFADVLPEYHPNVEQIVDGKNIVNTYDYTDWIFIAETRGFLSEDEHNFSKISDDGNLGCWSMYRNKYIIRAIPHSLSLPSPITKDFVIYNGIQVLEGEGESYCNQVIKKGDSVPTTYLTIPSQRLSLTSTPQPELQKSELEKAYDYAYSRGITTMANIHTANLDRNLTRAQAAKMLSQFAMSELEKTPDYHKFCSFSDSAGYGDLTDYMKTACQLGIMGVGLSKFYPNNNLTRAEFGTALSRVLYGEKYNSNQADYRTYHLQALHKDGIINDISNPNMFETRGNVMLMFYRYVEVTRWLTN